MELINDLYSAESDFKTPVQHLRKRPHSSVNPAARSLYSPVVRFTTPTKDSKYLNCGHKPALGFIVSAIYSAQVIMHNSMSTLKHSIKIK